MKDIPGILAAIEELQVVLVEDSRFLAKVLLDNIDCASLLASDKAREECDIGLFDFYANGLDVGKKDAERIDYFNKAWQQAVKALDELGVSSIDELAVRFPDAPGPVCE